MKYFNTRLFFALVGPTGSGKSHLVRLMLDRYPDHLTDIASFTSRYPRDSDQPGSYTYTSRDQFEKMIATDQLVQWVEYGGNLYGDTHVAVESAFQAGRCIIRPLVESSVVKFRDAGYTVLCIGIDPVGEGHKPNEAGREKTDVERAKTLKPDVSIVNSFFPGGLQAAADSLAVIILNPSKYICNRVRL